MIYNYQNILFLIYKIMRSELNTDLLRDLNNVILLAL